MDNNTNENINNVNKASDPNIVLDISMNNLELDIDSHNDSDKFDSPDKLKNRLNNLDSLTDVVIRPTGLLDNNNGSSNKNLKYGALKKEKNEIKVVNSRNTSEDNVIVHVPDKSESSDDQRKTINFINKRSFNGNKNVENVNKEIINKNPNNKNQIVSKNSIPFTNTLDEEIFLGNNDGYIIDKWTSLTSQIQYLFIVYYLLK